MADLKHKILYKMFGIFCSGKKVPKNKNHKIKDEQNPPKSTCQPLFHAKPTQSMPIIWSM